MKAMVHEKYGGPEVLHLAHIESRQPQRNEVLVRVATASLNAADLLAISGKPLFVRFSNGGLFRPRNATPGTDVVGTVEAVGPEATHIKQGMRVVADLSLYRRGGFAEYVTVTEDALVQVPDAVDPSSAAALPMSAVTAYQAINRIAAVKEGDRVFIDGASGGVGTFAVQIAKAAGAHVTALCGPSKVDVAREIGADVIVARNGSDPLSDRGPFDVIHAVNGRLPLSTYVASLADGGRFVMTGGNGALAGQVMLRGKGISRKSGKKVRFLSMRPEPADLAAVVALVEGGSVRPVIDRTFALDDIAAGLRYLSEGKARGKVLVSINPAN